MAPVLVVDVLGNVGGVKKNTRQTVRGIRRKKRAQLDRGFFHSWSFWRKSWGLFSNFFTSGNSSEICPKVVCSGEVGPPEVGPGRPVCLRRWLGLENGVLIPIGIKKSLLNGSVF